MNHLYPIMDPGVEVDVCPKPTHRIFGRLEADNATSLANQVGKRKRMCANVRPYIQNRKSFLDPAGVIAAGAWFEGPKKKNRKVNAFPEVQPPIDAPPSKNAL